MEKKDLFWFFTKSEYEDAKDELTIPYVAYIKATDEVIYKQEEDMFLKAWVDDFPMVVKNPSVFIQDPYENGSNPYLYSGDTMEIDGVTYYLWTFDEDATDKSYFDSYVLTTSVDFNTLNSQSMQSDINNVFTSYYATLDYNSEIYKTNKGNNNDQKLIMVESLQGGKLRIWIDDFPSAEKVGLFVYDKSFEEFVEDPEGLGCNPYTYNGTTLFIHDVEYYLWDSDDQSQVVPYIATTSVDFNTLYSESMEDDLNNHFTSYFATLNLDYSIYKENKDNYKDQKLVKVEMTQDNKVKIWIDDFPPQDYTKFVEEPQEMGCNPYLHTGDTITIGGTTYFKWSYVGDDSNWKGCYLLTTSDQYDALRNQSMEVNMNNHFPLYYGILRQDNEIYNLNDGSENDQRLVKLEKVDPITQLRIWIDDFPKDVDYEHTKEEYVEDPESLGCNPYVFSGDTLTIDGTTYYKWELERSSSVWHESVAYVLTTSCDYNVLYSQSMENDLDSTFDAYFAQLSEDESIYKENVGDDYDQRLVKIERL